MRGGNSAHGCTVGNGASNYNGPYAPTGCGMPLNLISDSRWTGLLFDFGP